MKYLFLSLCITFFTHSWSQTQNTWTKKASFAGLKRTRAIGFAIDNYGYLGMGEDTAEMTHNDLWRYDPGLDVWTQMMNLPGSTRRNASAVAVGSKGYVGLGADSSVSWMGTILNDWWEYDPGTNNWTQKASYPGGYNVFNQTGTAGVYFATAFSINDKAYICCGKMGSDFYGTDLWEYDPNTDSWSRKADFPGGDRYQMTGFGLEGKGYVGLGIDHDLFRKDWWQYDPNTDSWTEMSSLPGVERGAASSFVLSQRGYIVFGSDGGYKDELWEYNPFSDSWNIKANFPADGRKNAVAFAINNKGYAGTGSGVSGKRKSFWEYTPLLPIGFEENTIEMQISQNPIVDQGTVTAAESNVEFNLYNLNGQLVYSTQENSFSISASDYQKGTYILTITSNQTVASSKKITIL